MSLRSIKTVHLTNYYHKDSGGISTSFNDLMDAAVVHKRHVRLIVPGAKDSVEDRNEYARVYYVRARHSPVFDKRYRIMLPWQYMIADSPIRRILLEERPDIIEVTDKYTLSPIGPMIRLNKFKRLGRPAVVHFTCERMDDNVASFLTSGRAGRWLSKNVIANYILPGFDYHIANSAYTSGEFFESAGSDGEHGSSGIRSFFWRRLRAPRIPLSERVFVAERGVDAETFSPKKRSGAARRELAAAAGIPESSVMTLYAGRLSPEKNIGLLAEMMGLLAKERIADYRLIVAGDGPMSKWLRDQGGQIGDRRIVQLGHLDKERLADLYANADIFVHPNPREPFGIGPLEAMASGLPVVGPNAGGILSYATNENAWLVEPTGEAFASAADEIIADPELRDQKVERALETVRANTSDASTERLFAIYDEIFEHFNLNREMFTDVDAVRGFDYKEVMDA